MTVNYRRLPYAVRFVVALVVWLIMLAALLILKVMFLPLMPFVWSQSAFGLAKTQSSVQTNINMAEFYSLTWPPRLWVDWDRLLGRGGGSADNPANARLVEELSDGGA